MAYTTQQLTALEAAIAEGALIVTYGDRRVQYRSLEEMQAIRRAIRLELGLDPVVERNLRLSQTRKGLE